MSLIEVIAQDVNLAFAWKKFKNAFKSGEVWVDEFDMLKFEANIEASLSSISEDIRKGKYLLTVMQEIPYPKASIEVSKLGEEDINDPCVSYFEGSEYVLRYRAKYYVSIRDQVAWIAIINVIGETFESQMPEWSYNYRLYRRMWHDKEENVWRKGLIRPSDKQLYRKWVQTWPLYRKQISATIRILKGGIAKENLDNQAEMEDDIKTINDSPKFVYFDNYFVQQERKEIYWASLDIKKFYPSINIQLLKDKIFATLSPDEATRRFFDNMFDFKVKDKTEINIGLPTGLYVAGFLANIYLIDADNYFVNYYNEKKENKKEQDIAQFRYVDDHIILGTDYKTLEEWKRKYTNFLKDKLGLSINDSKSNTQEQETNGDIIPETAILNTDYPTPLMTISLQKVSAISSMNMELLSSKEFALVLMDLQQMLVADIPDEEIKRETRISFAITMLSRIIVDGEVDWDALYELRKAALNTLYEEQKQKQIVHSDELDNIIASLFDDSLPQIQQPKGRTIFEIEAYNKRLKAELAQKDLLLVRIFRLIMYALNEVPDKPKIWIRALQFIYNHPSNKNTKVICIDRMIKLLETLRDKNKIHPRSYDYLYATLLKETSKLLIKHINEPKYRNVNKMAFQAVKSYIENYCDDASPLYSATTNIVVCACIYYCLSNGMECTLLDGYDDTLYIIYAISLVCHEPNKVSAIYDVWEPTWRDSIYKKEFIKNVVQSKALMYKFYESKDGKAEIVKFYQESNWPQIELEWLEETDNKTNGLCDFIKDHNLTYLSRIQLMINIVKTVKEIYEKKDEWRDYSLFNIYNFVLDENKKITFSERILDPRCVNRTEYGKPIDYFPSYQMGIIFYQVLSGTPYIPEILNTDLKEINWNNHIMNMDCTVSSMSIAILKSCLVDRSLETRQIGKIMSDNIDFIRDICLDPPVFLNIEDLLNALEIERDFLERYQISYYSDDNKNESNESDNVILIQETNISTQFHPNPQENDEYLF